MSYEGFDQYWCKNGHYFERDVYSDDLKRSVCPVCGAQWAKVNSVDQTNETVNFIEPKAKDWDAVHVEPIYEIPGQNEQ